jgi:PAS domain S-box-containing protein
VQAIAVTLLDFNPLLKQLEFCGFGWVGRMKSGFFDRYHAEAGDVLDAILTTSRDCIMLLSLDGEIEYASNSAASALGLEDAADAVGESWPSFWPDSERAALNHALSVAARGEVSRYEGAIPAIERSTYWQVTLSPVRGADQTVTHLLKVSTDITAEVEAAKARQRERDDAAAQIERADVIARELRHRLKNQLAIVGAVAKLLARHTDDAQQLASKLEDKLIALAQAQDLLSMLREAPLDAGEAVEQVMRASGAGERIDIADIPDARLPDESVQQLALILGELQTNALKHGALRTEEGRVHLSGTLGGEMLTFFWRETCPGQVRPVDTGGGGFQLIRRLGSSSGQKPRIGWNANGIEVDFHVRAYRGIEVA